MFLSIFRIQDTTCLLPLLLGKYLKRVCQSLSRVWLFCNPVNCNPPGSSVRRISQAKILEWVAFPSSGDIPHPGLEPVSAVLQADSLPLSRQGPLAGQKNSSRDFPSGPVVKTPWFQCWGTGSIPSWGTKILHATQPKTKWNKEKRWF